MEVSRTLSAINRWRVSRPLGQRASPRLRRFVCALVCGTTLSLTGCQSSGLFSKSRKDPDALVKEKLAQVMQQERPLPRSDTATAAGPQAAGTSVAQHLRSGDQALADHVQNPARLSEARNHFEEVLRTDPNHATAHHRLGVIADLSHNFGDAERHYAQALKVNPHDSQLLHDIGYSYILQDRPAEAIPYLTRSLEVAPGFDMAARKLADAYVRTRQPELAQQTLRQVLPETQVSAELQRLQAAHDPASKPSLLGRMRENMWNPRPDEESAADSPTRQLLADLERARLEQERTYPERSQQPSGRQFAAGTMQPTMALHDSQISQALAAIEQDSRPRPGRPMLIDPRSGGAPHYTTQQGLAAISNQWGGPNDSVGPQSAAGPMTGGQVPMNTAPPIQPVNGYQTSDPAAAYYGGHPQVAGAMPVQAREGEFQYAEVIRGTQRGTASPQEAYLAQQGGAGRPWGAQGTTHTAPQANGISMTGGRFTPGSLSDQNLNPMTGGVQSADYSLNSNPVNTDPGLAGRRPSMLPPPAVGPDGRPTGAANSASIEAQPGDDYQAAAALGMGAGPGQMFPLVRQTEVVSPGTNSMWNGAQYPQAGRQLPMDRPVADLSQAYQMPNQPTGPHGSMVTGPSSLGQQMPSGGQYYSSANQFGSGQQYGQPEQAGAQQQSWTASTFQLQPPTPGAENSQQVYDQLRAQYDAQRNAQIQQVQGQYPGAMMRTPSYGLPVERPDPGSAMMNSWYDQAGSVNAPANVRQVVTPESYPSGPGPIQPAGGQLTPRVAPLPNINSAAPQLPPAQYGENVVVPPTYSAGRAGLQTPGNSGFSSNAAGYQGPLIIPGQ